MISTVTTSTVTTVTTAAIAGSVALIGVLVLLILFIQKEISSASNNNRAKKLSLVLNIAIIPLLAAFVVLVGYRVAEVLK